MSDIAKICEVVHAYNQLVATYLGNNTARTRGVLLASVRRILVYVTEIRRVLAHVVTKYFKFNHGVKPWSDYIKK